MWKQILICVSCETRGECGVIGLGALFADADMKGSFIFVVLEDEQSSQLMFCYYLGLVVLRSLCCRLS